MNRPSDRGLVDLEVDLTTEDVCCNLCGSTVNRHLFTEDYRLGDAQARLAVVRCLSCGLVYVSPRLTPESTEAVYRLDQSTTISHSYCWSGNSSGDRFRQMFLRLKPLLPGGRLLDVGCGSGQLLAEAKLQGNWEVMGVEPSQQAAEAARRNAGCQVHASTLEEAPVERGAFDVIVMLGVLEHLHHPLETLQLAHDLLKPSGILVIYVPNFIYLRAKDTGIASFLRNRRWSNLHPQEHLFHFTPRTLGRLLQKSRFQKVRIDIGQPFLSGSMRAQFAKKAAYFSAQMLYRLSGVHVGGIEAIFRRID